MKLKNLFERDRSLAKEEAERALVEGLRFLGRVCSRLADMVESRRLERAGFEAQGRFLERLDGRPEPVAPRPPNP